MVVTAEEGKTWSSKAIVALSWLKKRVPLLTASFTCSRHSSLIWEEPRSTDPLKSAEPCSEVMMSGRVHVSTMAVKPTTRTETQLSWYLASHRQRPSTLTLTLTPTLTF